LTALRLIKFSNTLQLKEVKPLPYRSVRCADSPCISFGHTAPALSLLLARRNHRRFRRTWRDGAVKRSFGELSSSESRSDYLLEKNPYRPLAAVVRRFLIFVIISICIRREKLKFSKTLIFSGEPVERTSRGTGGSGLRSRLAERARDLSAKLAIRSPPL
jgi:hypothetical protein